MDFQEIMGFIITVLAVTYLVGKTIYDFFYQKKSVNEDDSPSDDKGKALRDFLRSLEGDMADAEKEEKNIPGRRKKSVTSLSPPLAPPVQKQKNMRRSEKKIEKRPELYKDAYKFPPNYDTYRKKENVIDERMLAKQAEREEVASKREREGGAEWSFQGSENAYDLTQKVLVNRGRALLSRQKSKKDMIILSEIVGAPKGLGRNNLLF